MARIKNGILDGFSGKVGTVVGSHWRGINYMRAVSRKRRTTVTENQKVQQSRFALMRGFLKSMSDLLVIGYKGYALQMSEVNSALSYNLKNAVTGNYPDFGIAYEQVVLSRGALPNGKTPGAVAGAAGTVNFNWTDNSNTGKAKSTDKAILVAYCESLNETLYAIAPLRSAETGSLQVPGFSGQTVQTWISFISADGKETATSVFTGAVNIV